MRILQQVGLFILFLLLFLAGQSSVAAQNQAQTFTLQPGGRATISFEAFCTDFGLDFPLSIQAPDSVGEETLRGALAYIQTNGLGADQARALEAQYGIWQVQGATGSPAGGNDAAAVVNAASTPPTNPQGTSLIDAIAANQVRVSITNWQPAGQQVPIGERTDYFYGRGTIEVENTSQQALNLYMPVGTQFAPTTAGEQTMAGYATNVQVSNPATPTPAANQSTTNQTTNQANDPAAARLPNTGGSEGQNLLLISAVALLVAGFAVRLARHVL
jgi:LPXTG-motif cell wall-anchored protein